MILYIVRLIQPKHFLKTIFLNLKNAFYNNKTVANPIKKDAVLNHAFSVRTFKFIIIIYALNGRSF